MRAGGVVIDNVEYHGNSPAVTFVDKCLIMLTSAISLVKGEIRARVISPAVVSVKLLDRHKFYCVNAEILEIIELFLRPRKVVSGTEIPQMKLINHNGVFVRNIVILYLPIIFGTIDLKCGHKSRSSGRIGRHIRVGRRGYPFVLSAIDNLGIWVGNA